MLLAEDAESKRTRTTFVNTYLENDGVGRVLENFSLSQETLLDLLKLGNERGQRIKELEAKLAKYEQVNATPKIIKIPFKIDATSAKTRGGANKIEQIGQGIEVTSNIGTRLNLLQTERFKVNPGDKISVPYKITLQPGGRISLGLLNTKQNGCWERIWLDARNEKAAKTFEAAHVRVVPEGETECSLFFFNEQEKPAQSIFTIESIDILK